jgi:DNA (cytosine-5)-methyltransferase 1
MFMLLLKKLYVKHKLFGLKMSEGSDLNQYINVFNHIVSNLKRVDVKFDNEDKALMLLNSLHASPMYENLVTTLM